VLSFDAYLTLLPLFPPQSALAVWLYLTRSPPTLAAAAARPPTGRLVLQLGCAKVVADVTVTRRRRFLGASEAGARGPDVHAQESRDLLRAPLQILQDFLFT
jgi:hypothetical protein